MEDTYKQYHGSIFSHKRGNWVGMDQGKGDLYRGNTVEFMLNINNDDNVLTTRFGQEVKRASVTGINAGERTVSGVSIVSGTNLFFSTTFPSLSLGTEVFVETIEISCTVSGEMTETSVMAIEATVDGDYGVPETHVGIEATVSGTLA